MQFARIFFRNSFNIGLPLIETDTSKIDEGDQLQIDLDKGCVKNLTKGMDLEIKPLPKFMQDILREGGIMNYYRKYGELKI
jgi:3-isopropylmalate/(R)-2-methylmalate dehydratase small subunit